MKMIDEEWAKDLAKENIVLQKHAQKIRDKGSDVNKKFDKAIVLIRKQKFVLGNFAINISYSLQLDRFRTYNLITEICKYYPKKEVLVFFESVGEIYSTHLIRDWYKELGPHENSLKIEMKEYCY